MLLNLLLIILGFGILIFVHELGHFLAARWAGIRTEAFAIGMGTPVVAWRRGVGFALGSTRDKVLARTGKSPNDLTDAQLREHGIGETEYSLRWLPIGGFVKMLGQDDVDPGRVSSDPRSFNVCPIGKRMVVISAGVAANLVFAVVLFIVAFLVGVRFEAPVVGAILPGSPAALTDADDAAELARLGVQTPRLRPGDEIVSIDGEPVRTFADVTIAVSMSNPGTPIRLAARRAGVEPELRFTLLPSKDRVEGLLSIGIGPGSSTRLSADLGEDLLDVLRRRGLGESGLRGGLVMTRAGEDAVSTYEQFHAVASRSGGAPVPTVWREGDPRAGLTGPELRVDVPAEPVYQVLRYAQPVGEGEQDYEEGLLGLAPLCTVARVVEGSPNEGILRPGDLILSAGRIDGPRQGELRSEVKRHARRELPMMVLRDGEPRAVTAKVTRKGMLQVLLGYATDVPLVARPLEQVGAERDGDGPVAAVNTPVADLQILPRSRVETVGGDPIEDWAGFRAALRRHTAAARAAGEGAEVSLGIVPPTPGAAREDVTVRLAAADIEALHALGWHSLLTPGLFDPLYTTLDAGGNPLRAAVMGFEQTHKFIVVTYLTLDRLIRGSVGVEQIRGPVGIVHAGAQIADRGLMYLVFFLGIISVNLAVINFLPLPIVDGGLFLFLIYEKLKGRPPSLAFQNAATIVGLALIGTLLLVVTWNDVVRLLS